MHSNVFDQMDEVHITQIWTELENRFGFPSKQWKKHFKEHLDKQLKSENDISVFIKFGEQQINPILNSLLLRSPYNPTFDKLCQYVITRRRSRQRK